MADQRSGAFTQINWYPETSGFKTDPASPLGFVGTLAERDGFTLRQRNILPVTVYKGDREPLSNVTGLINSAGTGRFVLDFRFIGHMFTSLLGKLKQDGVTATYTRAASRHRWMIGKPLSGQWEKLASEADPAPLRFRAKGHIVADMDFASEQEGPAMYGITTLGAGDVVNTALGGTLTDEPFESGNYLNGSISKDGVQLLDVSAFNVALHGNPRRSDFRFNSGIANFVTAGKFTADGTLGLAFKDLDYYLEAVNEERLSVECLYANRPLESSPDKWLRIMLGANLFGSAEPAMGGDEGVVQDQQFRLEKPSIGYAADVWAQIAGPYLIPADGALGVKINGGATVVKTLTPGAARTATQIVTDLLAAGGIAGATSDVYLGRPRIRTVGLTGASTVQIDTATTDSAHVVLGFDGTVRSGADPTALVVELENGSAVDYI